MMTPQRRLTQAAQALAQSAASQHIPQSITVQEALDYVDDPLVIGWIAIAQTTQSPQQLLADLCAEMSETDARAVLCGTMVHPEIAGKLVATALRERIARELVREAGIAADNLELTASSRSFASAVDDPILQDRRFLARSGGRL